MPNLQQLLDRSGADMKPMASRFSGSDTPHTGPAWTTIYTGLRAEQHGVTEEGWVEGAISLIPHFGQTVFHELMEHGLSVGSLSMAITYPAQISNDESWMVSGYPSATNSSGLVAPEQKQTDLPEDYNTIQAKNLFDDMRPKSPQHWQQAERKKVLEVLPQLTTGDEDVLFYGTQITDTMAHRAKYRPFLLNGGVKFLADKTNQLLGTTFQPPRVGSIAWTEEMRTAYQTLDKTIGSLVNEYKPKDVLIISDHGFELTGENHRYVGASIATEGIVRPESIIEVKRVILERMGITPESGSKDIDRPEDELDDGATQEVNSQLEALGYR